MTSSPLSNTLLRNRVSTDQDRQLTRENHAVPAAYLRGWAEDGRTVFASRLLVPRLEFPLWTQQGIRGLLRYTDLYTSVRNGEESDAVERWLNDEFENPAAEALARVRADEPLTSEHWRRLGRYVLALDQRTPGNYFESTKRWEQQIPGMIKNTLEFATTGNEEARAKRAAELAPTQSAKSLPLRVWTERNPECGGVLHAEIVNGRELWLHSMRHTLTETIEKIPKLTWSILTPYRDSEWFTSDHPVLRLGYKGENEYDFGGGWGRKNCEILVPISPRHLLYAKVGEDRPPRGEQTREMTWMMQRFIAERADRWIINRAPASRPLMFKRRYVNQEYFDNEEKLWDEWHARQRAAERGPPDVIVKTSPTQSAPLIALEGH